MTTDMIVDTHIEDIFLDYNICGYTHIRIDLSDNV